MSLRDTITDRFVDLLERDDAPEPRGESREQRTRPARTEGRDETTSLSPYDTRTHSQRTGGQFYSFGYTNEPDTEDPPADMGDYWDVYETFSLCRIPINNFASEVIEPGPRVDSDNEELTAALEDWQQSCGIKAGEMNQPINGLLWDIVVQRYARGNAVMELASSLGNEDILAGLILHNPATFKTYKRPNQNILLLPDDPSGEAPTTPTGDTAAYVQYDDSLSSYDDKEAIPFSQDEIVKFVLDADVGESWGTSIIASCYDRVMSFRKKLSDSDAAIEMKGHPHHLYKLPFGREEAREYRQNHEKGEFSTGQKDFVPEGVEVDIVSGETADIEHPIHVDIETIFAAMPMPKFTIAFEESVNQFVVSAQQDEHNRLIDEERRYLEGKLGPVYRMKARELIERGDTDVTGDEDDIESVSFSIEQPDDENPLRRDDFDPDRFATVVGTFADQGIILSKNEIAWFMGLDWENLEDDLGEILPTDGEDEPTEPPDSIPIDPNPDPDSENGPDDRREPTQPGPTATGTEADTDFPPFAQAADADRENDNENDNEERESDE